MQTIKGRRMVRLAVVRQGVGLVHGLPRAGEVVETVIRDRRPAFFGGLLVVACVIALAACGPPPPRVAAPLLAESQTAISREHAAAALGAARALIGTGAHLEARAQAARVIPDAERWGWLDVASDAHYLAAETFDRERKPREAADAYARAYDASRRLGDRTRGLRALNALTNALLDAGLHEKAGEAAAEAYRLALRDNAVVAQATAQNNLAEADRLAGRLTEARDGYERALGFARQAQDRALVASILLNLGAAERLAGRLAEARRHFAEARDLARDLDDRRAGAYATWSLEQIETDIRRQGGQR